MVEIAGRIDAFAAAIGIALVANKLASAALAGHRAVCHGCAPLAAFAAMFDVVLEVDAEVRGEGSVIFGSAIGVACVDALKGAGIVGACRHRARGSVVGAYISTGSAIADRAKVYALTVAGVVAGRRGRAISVSRLGAFVETRSVIAMASRTGDILAFSSAITAMVDVVVQNCAQALSLT